MAERSFLNDILRRVAGGGRRKPERGAEEGDLVEECHVLLSDQSEASGLVRAQRILDRLDDPDSADKLNFFERVANEFGVDDAVLQTAIDAWSPGDVEAARKIHFAAEPQC